MSTRKRHWKIIATAALILLGMTYVVYALIRPLPVIIPTLSSLPAKPTTTVSLPLPNYGESAVGAVGYGVLGSTATQTATPTASTIKILTALSVLKQHPLKLGEQGPTLTLTQADVDSYDKYVAEDGSVVHVAVGEQISEYQALQAMLLPSANNMAETLARWAFGSIDAYNTAATLLATQLGMAHTTVTDPSGFLPSTLSTAHDLTILGETAIQNPVIATIVDQTSAVIPVQGMVRNVNELLGQDGIIGIKTGNSDQDRGAFLFAASRDVDSHPITIVGTILNGQNLGTAMHDSLALITTTGQSFTLSSVVHAGDVVGHYTLPWGKTVQAVAQKSVTIITWNADKVDMAIQLQRIHVTQTTTQAVGKLTIHNTLDNTELTSPVVLQHTIPSPSWGWRLKHAF